MNNIQALKHPGLNKGKTKAEGSFYIITVVSMCKSKGFVNLNVHFKLCTITFGFVCCKFHHHLFHNLL